MRFGGDKVDTVVFIAWLIAEIGILGIFVRDLVKAIASKDKRDIIKRSVFLGIWVMLGVWCGVAFFA